MRDKIMLLAAALLLSGAASLAPAQKVEKNPRGPVEKDKNKYAVKFLPDLVVGLENRFSSSLIVRVANKCKGTALSSYITIYLPDDKGTPVLIGKDVKALAPGENASITFTIPSNLKIKSFQDKWMRITVDPQNKIKEASEGNNWWEPNAQPFPEKGGYCEPPYTN